MDFSKTEFDIVVPQKMEEALKARADFTVLRRYNITKFTLMLETVCRIKSYAQLGDILSPGEIKLIDRDFQWPMDTESEVSLYFILISIQ